jgi:hypothetical protein
MLLVCNHLLGADLEMLLALLPSKPGTLAASVGLNCIGMKHMVSEDRKSSVNAI